MPDTPPLLQVQNLRVQFRRSPTLALDGVSFLLQPGEAIGVLGESGAGKTTLARTILRLLPPGCEVVSGSLQFGQTELLQASENELQKVRGAQISFISQEPELALNPVLPIGEQVADVIHAHFPLKWHELRQEAISMLQVVGLTDERFFSAYPHQLSGGQRQRVVIAQALACKPKLLIADEPTSALDNVAQAEILDLLKKLRARLQLALVFITHNPALLEGLTERVFVMYEGRIVEEGIFEQICGRPRHSFTQTLMQAIHSLPAKSSASSEIQQSESLLEVRHLSKSYVRGGWRSATKTHVLALADVSLRIERGSTLALVGKSGSGKSTFGRCLARLEDPDAGEIQWQGQDILKLSRRELIPMRRRIQLIFQHSATAMNPRLPVMASVEEPLLMQGGLSKEKRRERTLALMEQVGIPAPWADRRPLEFSGGQRQRLALARALILEPDLLIFDEALAGLDLSTQTQIVELLKRLQASRHFTYLFITHDLQMAAHLANTIAVMKEGRLVEVRRVADLLTRPQEESLDLIRSIPRITTARAFPHMSA